MAIRPSLVQKGEQLRLGIENSAAQDLAPVKLSKSQYESNKIEEKNGIKNSLIPSYNREMENLSAIERLKKEYGIEKNIVLTKENVENNRELIEKYTQFFSVYPDIRKRPQRVYSFLSYQFNIQHFMHSTQQAWKMQMYEKKTV